MSRVSCGYCGEAEKLVTRSDMDGVLAWCHACFRVTDMGASRRVCCHHDQDECLLASIPTDMAQLCQICPKQAAMERAG